MTENLMGEFDIYEVRQTPKPNDYTKNIVEGTPILCRWCLLSKLGTNKCK